MFVSIFIFLSSIKFLLIPLYHSTDFEVHRNWLAITHSLPVSKWYFEDTSEWTLDYPPVFAFFEYALSKVAIRFDAGMLNVASLNYISDRTILFQRLSVIVTDIIYAAGVKSCINAKLPINKQLLLFALLIGNTGLYFVDHIHFQYNGMLFGILLLSISNLKTKNYLRSAFYFALLLNMKHIFIYIAPAYIVFLFKQFCLNSREPIKNLVKLGSMCLGVTAASFALFYNHIPQVLSRLFPFKRGLCHAYWAPNFWAVYNIIDKSLAILFGINSKIIARYTGGLVQEFEHQVLPSIKPSATFVLTAVTMIPCLYKLFTLECSRASSVKHFIRVIVLCACTSFMFGWHVHEKAILMVLIPLSLLSIENKFEAKSTIFLTIVATYSLFPLLYHSDLLWVKLSFLVFTVLFVIYTLNQFHGEIDILWYEKLYLLGFVLLFLFQHLIQYQFKLHKKLPFLPLMFTSLYCSVGVIYFWLTYYLNFLRTKNELFPQSNNVTNDKLK